MQCANLAMDPAARFDRNLFPGAAVDSWIVNCHASTRIPLSLAQIQTENMPNNSHRWISWSCSHGLSRSAAYEKLQLSRC